MTDLLYTVYDNRMTERTTLVQARLSEHDTRQVDHDAAVLGLRNRSEALREGLRLLHQRASHADLARDYDAFYGTSGAPTSDITAAGDQVAAEGMNTDDDGG